MVTPAIQGAQPGSRGRPQPFAAEEEPGAEPVDDAGRDASRQDAPAARTTRANQTMEWESALPSRTTPAVATAASPMRSRGRARKSGTAAATAGPAPTAVRTGSCPRRVASPTATSAMKALKPRRPPVGPGKPARESVGFGEHQADPTATAFPGQVLGRQGRPTGLTGTKARAPCRTQSGGNGETARRPGRSRWRCRSRATGRAPRR